MVRCEETVEGLAYLREGRTSKVSLYSNRGNKVHKETTKHNRIIKRERRLRK